MLGAAPINPGVLTQVNPQLLHLPRLQLLGDLGQKLLDHEVRECLVVEDQDQGLEVGEQDRTEVGHCVIPGGGRRRSVDRKVAPSRGCQEVFIQSMREDGQTREGGEGGQELGQKVQGAGIGGGGGNLNLGWRNY